MFGPILFNRKLAKAYKNTFNTIEGREVLKDLVKFCKVYQPTFSVDPHHTAFNEGMRRVALRVINFIERDETDKTELNFNLMKDTDDDQQY